MEKCQLAVGSNHSIHRGLDRSTQDRHLHRTDQLNAIGDFLPGVFSPLAFVWLVAAVLTPTTGIDRYP